MFRLTMELVGNCIFALSIANGKRNRLPSLKIGVLQRSGLAPLLLNIYTSYILTGIQHAELRRKGTTTLSLARWVMEYGRLLNSVLMFIECKCTAFRHPFVLAAQQLIISTDNNIRAAHWEDHR